MSGYRKDGAQAVYIAGSGSQLFEATTSGTLNTSTLFAPVGNHLSNASLSSAVTLTPPSDTNAIKIAVVGQGVRVKLDGNDAAATTGGGFPYNAGDIFTYQFAPGSTLSVIETTSGAEIEYQWGKI